MNNVNGSKWGKISVTPSDWEEPTANVKKQWCISYRFYDSSGKPKQIRIRGMNYDRKWKDRKATTRFLLDQEEERLKKGYNPIEKILFANKQTLHYDKNADLRTDRPFKCPI